MAANASKSGSVDTVGPSTENEITPEMIEAGTFCLNQLLDGITPESGLMCIPSDWAALIYRAMEKCRVCTPR
jgi:hypothetical protein